MGAKLVPDYQGPLGINDILVAAASARQLDAVAMWTDVPTYWESGNPPYLRGSHALLKMIQELTGIDFNLAPLKEEADGLDKAMDEFASRNPQFREELAQIEETYDEEVRIGQSDDVARRLLERGNFGVG